MANLENYINKLLALYLTEFNSTEQSFEQLRHSKVSRKTRISSKLTTPLNLIFERQTESHMKAVVLS